MFSETVMATYWESEFYKMKSVIDILNKLVTNASERIVFLKVKRLYGLKRNQSIGLFF